MNATGDLVGKFMDEEYRELIEKADILYDLAAINLVTGDTVNINLEKYNDDILNSTSIEDVYKNIVPVIEQAYKNMGATDFNYEITTDNIKGKTVTAMIAGIKIGGTTLYQIQICLKRDGYLANIAFSSLSAEGLVGLLEKLEWTK